MPRTLGKHGVVSRHVEAFNDRDSEVKLEWTRTWRIRTKSTRVLAHGPLHYVLRVQVADLSVSNSKPFKRTATFKIYRLASQSLVPPG